MTRMVDAKRQKNSVVTSPQIIPKPRDNVASTRLAYMADLLLELKDMATAEGHATLAGCWPWLTWKRSIRAGRKSSADDQDGNMSVRHGLRGDTAEH